MALSESIRKFHHTQVENKAPIRAELGREIAQWLAQGNRIQHLPGPTFSPATPKPRRPLIGRPLEAPRESLQHIPWDDKGEIELMLQLRAQGAYCRVIATTLNQQYGRGRTERAINAAIRAAKEGSLGRQSWHSWSATEDQWLEFLSAHGLLPSEIGEAITQCLQPSRAKDALAVRNRCEHLGIAINRAQRRYGPRSKNG